jgi:hypothetical protein
MAPPKKTSPVPEEQPKKPQQLPAETFQPTLIPKPDASQVGAMSAIAREEGEVKAAVAMAKRFPRNELEAYNRILKSCKRPGLAQEAIYSFPRGGATVEGPSINLAKAVAGAWGNMRHGHRIVAQTEETVHIMGYAWDMETNNFASYEDDFKKLIERKGQGWIKPDERDLRELITRRGAIVERNAILNVTPKDVIDDAVEECKKTMRAAASGELKQDRQQTIRSLVGAFEQLGVSQEMLAKNLGHDLEIVDEKEVTKLRGIWKSIADGISRRDEHFDVAKPSTAAKGSLDMADMKPKETQGETRAT